MSSDLFFFDSELQFVPPDPLLAFCNPSVIDSPDILLHDSIDQLSSAASYSPGGLGTVSSEFPVGFQDRPGCGFTGAQVGAVKDDWSPVRYEAFSGPHSYGGYESGVSSMEKYMQRSYSSSSFEEKPLVAAAAALYQPQFDSLMESADFQGQGMVGSPENRFFHGAPMRRVCSTGDLQRTSSPCPSAAESSFADEPSLKVGRYSAKEREERILKYRAKRTQRNFTKTIKYACRKTLADNRPRIRGRFARNDEIGELPKAASSVRDDDLWLGLQGEEEFGAGSGGPFLGQTQLQYSYGYNY